MAHFCPKCGAQLNGTTNFCEFCGANLPQQPQQPQPQYQQPQYQYQQPQYQQPQYQQPQYQYQQPPYQQPYYGQPYQPLPAKNKLLAALLAFFLGGLGIHKFYLGRTGAGIAMLLFCWTGIPAIIAFVDFIVLLCLSDQEFMQKYNCTIEHL